jgi:hypothetical protein
MKGKLKRRGGPQGLQPTLHPREADFPFLHTLSVYFYRKITVPLLEAIWERNFAVNFITEQIARGVSLSFAELNWVNFSDVG